MRLWWDPLCIRPTHLVGLFIVLAHWNNSPWTVLSSHSDTLSWFRANQSLLFSLMLRSWKHGSHMSIICCMCILNVNRLHMWENKYTKVHLCELYMTIYNGLSNNIFCLAIFFYRPYMQSNLFRCRWVYPVGISTKEAELQMPMSLYQHKVAFSWWIEYYTDSSQEYCTKGFWRKRWRKYYCWQAIFVNYNTEEDISEDRKTSVDIYRLDGNAFSSSSVCSYRICWLDGHDEIFTKTKWYYI